MRKEISFAAKVLATVKRIPPGVTLSYKEVAELSGCPNAWRAVGSILKKNYDTAIPCHRVIRSDGKYGGYNRGADLKRALLERELGAKKS